MNHFIEAFIIARTGETTEFSLDNLMYIVVTTDKDMVIQHRNNTV